MSARRIANERADAAKKWNATRPDGLELKPTRGTLGGYPMQRERCPVQLARVECYRLPCSHFLGVDAAHEILTASAYDAARPAIICPTCQDKTPTATQCMDCDGFRPFTWECPACLAPRCAACLTGCAFCDQCGANFPEVQEA